MAENQFQFKDTIATQKIFSLTKRIRAVAGGTSASKTISILIWLIDRGQSAKNEVMTVVAESVPHLKLGAVRDFKNIMIAQDYWKEKNWNASNFSYKFETGSILEFISFDKFGKAHGPRRDILFVNEANNLPYNIVDQLITRTKKIIWMDWNPTNEFYFYTEILPNRNDIDFITLTYKDCLNALDQTIIDEIESHKHNKNWWRVYGLGLLGEIEERIYTNWKIVDEIPHEARLERFGIDFGWNDPAAAVAVYYYNGGYIVDEVLYGSHIHNKPLADAVLNVNQNVLVVADEAEPKSIDEMKGYGLKIIGCKKKSKGSNQKYVKWSIGIVQQQKISITRNSYNILKEYRNYLWKTDPKTGEMLNEPEDKYSHSMDAIRYAITSLVHYPKKAICVHKPQDKIITSLYSTSSNKIKVKRYSGGFSRYR